MVGFPVQLHLVRLHHLLDGLAHVTETHVDAGVLQHSKRSASSRTGRSERRSSPPPHLDSSICGVPHSLQQLVVFGVKSDSEGTVDDSSYEQKQSRGEFDLVETAAERRICSFRAAGTGAYR